MGIDHSTSGSLDPVATAPGSDTNTKSAVKPAHSKISYKLISFNHLEGVVACKEVHGFFDIK